MSRARRETAVCLVLTDLLVLKERTECLEAPAHLVQPVPLVCLALKVSRELRVLLEELVQRERRVFRDPPDLLAHQGRSSSPCPSREVQNPSVPSMQVRWSLNRTRTCLPLTLPALSS